MNALDLRLASVDDVAAAQDRALRETLELCSTHHPYYRQRWREAGVDVAGIRTTNDLVRLPVTTKEHLAGDPESFQLDRNRDAPADARYVWELVHTTGTSSGRPTPIVSTTHDYLGYVFQARRAMEIAGIGTGDVLGNLVPVAAHPTGAFIRAGAFAAAAGIPMVTLLTGADRSAFGVHRSTDEAIRVLADTAVTVLWGLPSYVRQLLQRAVALGIQLPAVRMCSLTGERCSARMRSELQALMGAVGARGREVNDRYGTTETGGFTSCGKPDVWHNVAPESLFVEVLDPVTGDRAPHGERGILAATHLDRRGTLLVRYVVGDELSFDPERCPDCGRVGGRLFGPPARRHASLKIKGTLVDRNALVAALSELPELVEFQVVVQHLEPGDPLSRDDLVVRCALTEGADKHSAENLVLDTVRDRTGLRARLEYVLLAELVGSDKHDKFRDIRSPEHAERTDR